MRLEQEIREKNELIRPQGIAREEEQKRAEPIVRHQREERSRKLQAEQDAFDRRIRAKAEARAAGDQLAQGRARGREEKRIQTLRLTAPEAIYSLRQTVRLKYELDMSI